MPFRLVACGQKPWTWVPCLSLRIEIRGRIIGIDERCKPSGLKEKQSIDMAGMEGKMMNRRVLSTPSVKSKEEKG